MPSEVGALSSLLPILLGSNYLFSTDFGAFTRTVQVSLASVESEVKHGVCGCMYSLTPPLTNHALFMHVGHSNSNSTTKQKLYNLRPSVYALSSFLVGVFFCSSLSATLLDKTRTCDGVWHLVAIFFTLELQSLTTTAKLTLPKLANKNVCFYTKTGRELSKTPSKRQNALPTPSE